MNTRKRTRALLFLVLAYPVILPAPTQAGSEETPRPAPGPLAIVVKEVPRPKEVLGWGSPVFSPDGEWLTVQFVPAVPGDQSKAPALMEHGTEIKTGQEAVTRRGFQVGLVREDGTGFKCLTCNQERKAGRPIWFPDGKAFLFQTGYGVNNLFYVYDLTTRKAYPLKGVNSERRLVQNRFEMISPDGKKLCWTKVWLDGFHIVMGDLVKKGDRWRVEEVREIYPRLIADPSDPDQWAWALAWYENKDFTDGGRTLVFSGSRDQGGNLDDYLLDLETGEVKRLTTHREWDEGGEFSPDGRWWVFETTRAHEVLSVFANVPLPAFMDWVLVAPITAATLIGQWFAPHEPFLLDRWGDRRDYIGQRLHAAGDQDWAIRGGVHWHPGGRKIVWGELLGQEMRDSRILVGEFTGLEPGPALARVPTATPEWAPLLKDAPLRPLRVRQSLKGKFSGTADLDFKGRLIRGKYRVVFKDYSADGEYILNGFMSLQVKWVGVAHLQGDIQLSGQHSGFVKMDLNISNQKVSGQAVSEKDGQRFEKHF